jgi:hypothetical protein
MEVIMKKLSRIICIVLAALLWVSVIPFNTFAAAAATDFKLDVDAPEIGKKPDRSAVMPMTSEAFVSETKWEGELDENGRFKEGVKYTVIVHIELKMGENKHIQYVEAGPQVNGKNATLGNISADKRKAVISYTFEPLAKDKFYGMTSISSFSFYLPTRPEEASVPTSTAKSTAIPNLRVFLNAIRIAPITAIGITNSEPPKNVMNSATKFIKAL